MTQVQSLSYRDFGFIDEHVCCEHPTLGTKHCCFQLFDGFNNDKDDDDEDFSTASVTECCSTMQKQQQSHPASIADHLTLERLCHQIDTLHLLPEPTSSFNAAGAPPIPQHDWRILQRMAQKRRDLWHRTAAANAAHERWQREQRDRHVAAGQRAEGIARLAAESRDAHRRRFEERRRALWQRDRGRTHAIRAELLHKDDCVADRLDDVRFAQACRLEDKHTEVETRLAGAGWRRTLQDAERKQRQLECAAQQADRHLVAQQTREYQTERRRQQVAEMNVAEAAGHARRLRAVQWQQRDDVDRVQQRIVEHELRGGDFVRCRDERQRKQRRRAFWTGELREMVRQNVWWPASDVTAKAEDEEELAKRRARPANVVLPTWHWRDEYKNV